MSKNQTAKTQLVRSGEGALVDVSFLPNETVAGRNVASFNISLASVPVPHKRYSADTAFVEIVDETVLLLFAQRRIRNDGLRSLVIIKMDPEWVQRFLLTLAQADTDFDKYAESHNISADILGTVPEEPKDTVAFDANFTMAAISERQACLDFFYSSPFAFSASLGAKKLAVDPVLRVDLKCSLLLGVIAGMRDVIKRIPTGRILESYGE